MKTSDFDYKLPKKLIAQKALKKRDSARLIVCGKRIEHRKFYNILDYLKEGDVLVINETKVVRGKLSGRKMTGAPAEAIIERKSAKGYECRVKTRSPKVGTVIKFRMGLVGEIVGRDNDIFFMKFNKDVEKAIMKIGELPQPTYIKRKISEDEYQTVYASKPGSVAAPTAGLHFTNALLERARKKGVETARVCLHIGFGTFIPIEEEDFSSHRIHSEYFEIGKDAAGKINKAKRVVAVGTTSLRALESARYEKGKIKPCSGWAEVFIKPGYKFKSRTKLLITNFHLPRSTLILLASAFAGRNNVLRSYNAAIRKKYRFYSLGDATLLWRENSQPQ